MSEMPKGKVGRKEVKESDVLALENLGRMC